MQRLVIPLVLLAMAGVVMLFVKIGQLEEAMNAQMAESGEGRPEIRAGHGEEEEGGEEKEVAVYMGRMHLYAQKLWAAGTAGNVELAKFYQHEIEEVMLAVQEAEIVEDSVDVSRNMGVYGIPAIGRMEAHLDSLGLAGFATAYDGLIGNCNACHAISDHEIIRIIAPSVAPAGQEFAPAR